MTLQSDPSSADSVARGVSASPSNRAGTARSSEALRASIWRDLGREAGAGNGQAAVLEAILKAAFQLFPDAGSGAVFLYESDQLMPRLARWADGRGAGPAPEPAPAAVVAAAAVVSTAAAEA